MSVAELAEERRQRARRKSSGRREEEVGTDDLRALIDAQRRACERDREIYDREIAELKRSVAEERKARVGLTSRVVYVSGAITVVVVITSWIGPTVFRELLRGIFGAP